jgi:DnaJ-class molecular chaperone
VPRTQKTIAAKKPAPALDTPCPDCDGTGETPQPVTRRRGTVHGQMGVCLTCLGSGTAEVAPAPAPAGQVHP